VHDPVRFLAMWGSSFVENQSLSHSNPLSVAVNDFVAAGGLPESGSGGAVGAGSCGVLLVFVAEEVPIILRSGSYFAFLWKRKKKEEERETPENHVMHDAKRKKGERKSEE